MNCASPMAKGKARSSLRGPINSRDLIGVVFFSLESRGAVRPGSAFKSPIGMLVQLGVNNPVG
jgi:hypothetical protein